MENFNFYVPTDIRFGKDRLDELPAVLDQFGKNVLLVYGGGSIKRNGLYQQITDLAQKNGHTLIELSGVEPNPRIETVRKGIELCKENQVDVILAVGGGSTIDCFQSNSCGLLFGRRYLDSHCSQKRVYWSCFTNRDHLDFSSDR